MGELRSCKPGCMTGKKKKKKKNGVNKANIYGSKTKEEEKRENQRTDFFSRNRMNKAAMCAHTLSGFTRV